jgi:mannose-1-phosphate guanylyltransferase/mannose-6-phosphate isomerase
MTSTTQHAQHDSDAGTNVCPPLTIQPVILAGGSGTRLWPLSREQHPKQLIGLLGDESMLEATAHRLDGLSGGFRVAGKIILVCGETHRFTSAEQLRRSGKPAQILLEPEGRNTAPALTVAALAAIADGADAVLAVLPADHAVTDVGAFQQAVSIAAGYAADGAIVTMGVVPRRAETAYGYIRVGTPLDSNGGHAIDLFVEKPHQALADLYFASDEYWWNSGVFLMRASVWLAAIERLRPDIFGACQAAYRDGIAEGPFFRLDAAAFRACPADSIDYAVLEQLCQDALIPAVVVPLDAGWSDVGSWDAIWEILPKDAAGNAARGKVMFEDTSGSFVHSEGCLIACIGLHDVVVVETPDAVLVADKQHAQKVKAIVGRIRSQRGAEVHHHRKEYRPWGYYDSIDNGNRFQVKRIVVNPGASLSLQLHYHRAEHWVVVRGTARVTCGEEVFLLAENQSAYIPLGATHRLENPGKLPLEVIEVQSGDYLGEDDIVRLSDDFGRVESKTPSISPVANEEN